MEQVKVAACLVTRGDVDIDPVLASIPTDWEIIIWDNSALENLSVYGRYAAIDFTDAELIYVQDDDVFVSNPDAIRGEWQKECNEWYRTEHLYTEGTKPPWPGLVANMPQAFRHDGYTDSCLVGFGACFHRDAPGKAFERFAAANGNAIEFTDTPMWRRTCDVVFTALTPRVLMEIEKIDREFATAPERMYRQPGHVAERREMLELARRVRDASQ
jgi:hypothetical protein